MKLKYAVSALALASVCGGAAFAADTANQTYSATVTALSPEQTGWLMGGQVSVQGVGSGVVTLNRSAADMRMTGGALSSLQDTDAASATSNIESSFTFDRGVTTSGALVGIGNVVAMGESIGSMGTLGAADADTMSGGTSTDATGTSDASSAAEGSLQGSVSTSNTLQLLGTSTTFAGSGGLEIGELNRALAYGGGTVDAGSAIDLTDLQNVTSAELDLAGDEYVVALTEAGVGTSGTYAAGDYEVGDLVTVAEAKMAELIKNGEATFVRAGSSNSLLSASNAVESGVPGGAIFFTQSELNNDTTNLELSNAGGGSLSLTTSTGGFFSGGGAAGGSGALSQTGSFFSAVE